MCTFFHFPDAGLNLLNGFDFHFDLLLKTSNKLLFNYTLYYRRNIDFKNDLSRRQGLKYKAR